MDLRKIIFTKLYITYNRLLEMAKRTRETGDAASTKNSKREDIMTKTIIPA